MNEEADLPRILYDITGTFEFELLIELMLRYWEHPFAAHDDYRNTLFEDVATVLRQAAEGKSFGGMPPKEMNVVFAVWYVESSLLEGEAEGETNARREQWLATIRKSLPSCFCEQDRLN